MFRITIRDVLWLTVVVAFALLWWMEQRRYTPEDRELLRYARKLGFQVETAKAGSPPPAPNAVIVPGVSHP